MGTTMWTDSSSSSLPFSSSYSIWSTGHIFRFGTSGVDPSSWTIPPKSQGSFCSKQYMCNSEAGSNIWNTVYIPIVYFPKQRWHQAICGTTKKLLYVTYIVSLIWYYAKFENKESQNYAGVHQNIWEGKLFVKKKRPCVWSLPITIIQTSVQYHSSVFYVDLYYQ